MVVLPSVTVIVPGRVIAYVALATPVTVKVAAATGPGLAGKSATVPVTARPRGIGVRITVPVPAVTLPKFRCDVLEIAIGATMVADAVAVAEFWPKVLTENATITIANAKNFVICFIFF
jgi:hypothetical protein